MPSRPNPLYQLTRRPPPTPWMPSLPPSSSSAPSVTAPRRGGGGCEGMQSWLALMTAASPPPPSKIESEIGQCDGRLILPFALHGCQCVWDMPQGVLSLGSSAWCEGGYNHPVQATWLPVCVGRATPCRRPSREERGSAPRGSIPQRRCCCNPGRLPPPWCCRGEGTKRGARPKAWTCQGGNAASHCPVESSTLIKLSWACQVKPIESSPSSWAGLSSQACHAIEPINPSILSTHQARGWRRAWPKWRKPYHPSQAWRALCSVMTLTKMSQACCYVVPIKPSRARRTILSPSSLRTVGPSQAY